MVVIMDSIALLASGFNWTLSSRNLTELGSQPDACAVPSQQLVSVCLPMRNEDANVDGCLEAILANDYPNLEVLVYDDESSDGTAERLRQWQARDPRVTVLPARPLPAGWTGKQHACHVLSQAATGVWLLFSDADVRLLPGCLQAAVSYAEGRQAGLVSGVPRQLLGSLGEALIVPMIGYMLWSYLPLRLMRQRPELPITAGCGQFLLVRREAYAAAGGHAAFPQDTHDGLYLPRAVRAAGWKTDLIELAPLATCRMYCGSLQTWEGFSRNAFEALGSVWLLLAFTMWHLAHLSAWWLLPGGSPLAWAAVGLQLHQRWRWAVKLREPLWTVPLHPLSLVTMLMVQWWSLVVALAGRRSWKGRAVRGPSRP